MLPLMNLIVSWQTQRPGKSWAAAKSSKQFSLSNNFNIETTSIQLQFYYKRVLQYNWMMHQQLFNMPLRPLETVFALTSVALNAKCSHNNQQESAAFLWQGHFFSAERQKSPEIPRRRKWELEQVEKGESEELLRASSPFIGSAERDFPLSPCVFPSSQTWHRLWNFHTQWNVLRTSFTGRGSEKRWVH